MRTLTGMLSAACSTNAELLLNGVDCLLEAGSGVNDVVDEHHVPTLDQTVVVVASNDSADEQWK